MKDEELIIKIKALRDEYDRRAKDTEKESIDAYNSSQYNWSQKLDAKVAAYLGITCSLDDIIKEYESDAKEGKK